MQPRLLFDGRNADWLPNGVGDRNPVLRDAALVRGNFLPVRSASFGGSIPNRLPQDIDQCAVQCAEGAWGAGEPVRSAPDLIVWLRLL